MSDMSDPSDMSDMSDTSDRPSLKWLWVGLILCLVLVGWGYFVKSSAQKKLEVKEWKLVPLDYPNYQIRGLLTNRSSRAFLRVTVQFDLLDAQGQKTGQASASFSGLASQGTRTFEMDLPESVFDARVASVTGWPGIKAFFLGP